jgi:hypothetical protein
MMLALPDLRALDRSTRGQPVLSAYVPSDDGDPAHKGAARKRVEGAIANIKRSLGAAPREEREAFEAAASELTNAMSDEGDVWGSGSWIAFAAPDGVRHAERVAGPVPFAVEWRTDGILIAPYLRLLKQQRPLILGVISSEGAKLYRYQAETLQAASEVEAPPTVDEPSHMSAPPRNGFHHGVRGQTGRDETERRERAAFERLTNDVIRRLEDLTRDGAWIALGGTTQRAKEIFEQLPRSMKDRATVSDDLTLRLTEPEIREIAAKQAAELSRARDAAWLDEVINRGRAGSKATIAIPTTARALSAHAVHELFISAGFLESRWREAEQLVRAALDGGAEVEVVAGEGAARLDRECGGVAAELRFPLPSIDGSGRPEGEMRI